MEFWIKIYTANERLIGDRYLNSLSSKAGVVIRTGVVKFIAEQGVDCTVQKKKRYNKKDRFRK